MKKFWVIAAFILVAGAVFAGDMSDGSGSDAGLVGRWRWVSFSLLNEKLETGADSGHYVMTFEDDGTFAVRADCRRGNGTYRADGTNLTLFINSMTDNRCEEGSYGAQMTELIDRGTFEYSIENTNELQLSFAKGAGKADFLRTNDSL